jgi:hypothetical protein
MSVMLEMLALMVVILVELLVMMCLVVLLLLMTLVMFLLSLVQLLLITITSKTHLLSIQIPSSFVLRSNCILRLCMPIGELGFLQLLLIHIVEVLHFVIRLWALRLFLCALLSMLKLGLILEIITIVILLLLLAEELRIAFIKLCIHILELFLHFIYVVFG